MGYVTLVLMVYFIVGIIPVEYDIKKHELLVDPDELDEDTALMILGRILSIWVVWPVYVLAMLYIKAYKNIKEDDKYGR